MLQANEKSEPLKVISLAPHITEMLYSAGAGALIVGVDEFSDYPKEATKKPVVGNYYGINIEKIIQLKPDIIFAWREGHRLQDMAKLEKLGFKVIFSQPKKLTDIAAEIKQYGKWLGTEKQANQSALKIQQELQRLHQRYQTDSMHKKPKVFYQIWQKPLMTVNAENFISQAITLCGAQNIFADLPVQAGQVNKESLLNRNPDIILIGGDQATQQNWQKKWLTIKQLKAVQKKKIHLINANLYQRPTERFVMNIEKLCDLIATDNTLKKE